MDWKSISGILCDICGVLYDPDGFGGGSPIDGSIEAVTRLKEAKFPLKFLTNESQTTRAQLTARLQRMGFPVAEDDILSPVTAVRNLLIQRGWKAHCVLCEDAMSDLRDLSVSQDAPSADCVVIGDAADGFSYAAVNAAFQRLMANPQPRLISLGRGRYYRTGGQLHMDVGAYAAALEFACGVSTEVVGKPDGGFFRVAIEELLLKGDLAAGGGSGAATGRLVMVGDDIVSDIGGGMAAGLLGVQVRTGKFRPGTDEPHPTVTPTAYVDNLKQLVDHILMA